MVRRIQLFRLGVAFLNVDHFAFYRKLNGGCKLELFNRMYRIPEKRLDGSPSMTSDVRCQKISHDVLHTMITSVVECRIRFSSSSFSQQKSGWRETYSTEVWSTSCEIFWHLTSPPLKETHPSVFMESYTSGWISPANDVRFTSGKKKPKKLKSPNHSFSEKRYSFLCPQQLKKYIIFPDQTTL